MEIKKQQIDEAQRKRQESWKADAEYHKPRTAEEQTMVRKCCDEITAFMKSRGLMKK